MGHYNRNSTNKKRNIEVEVDMKLNQDSLKELKDSLQTLKYLSNEEFLRLNKNSTVGQAQKELNEIKRLSGEVEKALNKAFSTNLGTLNITKFNNELEKIDINTLYNHFSKAGIKGKEAFRNITKEALTTNMQLKQTHSLLDNMAETMGNTIKWGISSSVMNTVVGSVEKAYYYVKNLDSSLNDIRIVTNKSAEDMDKFAASANKAAKELSATTVDYTDASLIYYQQGLSEQDVAARTETTLKTANVTRQKTAEVSEQLTAVWNGYKTSAQEAELYVDKMAAVAATTASDLQELSVGMSKVASAANAMGVDIDKLNGMLSTVISVTRQAPESAGTAFKTIFARMEDLKLGKKDDEGVMLGDVSSVMKKMGIDIINSKNELRDLGDIIEEVGNKWNTGQWNSLEKQALAIQLAGKRQYNNLLALFDNWDMYNKAVETSQKAVGTLQEQQDIYLESTSAHLTQLKTSWENLYDSILDKNTINNLSDDLSHLISLVTIFIDGIGGGQNVLLGLGSIGLRVFSKQLAKGISAFSVNMNIAKNNADELRSHLESLNMFKGSKSYDKDDGVKYLVDLSTKMEQYYSVMDAEEINATNQLIRHAAEVKNIEIAWLDNRDAVLEYAKKITKNSNLTRKDLDVDKKTVNYEIIAERIEDITEKLEESQSALAKTKKSMKDFFGIYEKDSKTVLRKTKKKEFQSDIDKIKQAINNSAQMTSGMIKNTGLEGREVKDFQSLLERFNKYTYKNITSDMVGYKKEVNSLIRSMERLGNTSTSNIKELSQALEIGEKELGELTRDVEAANQSINTETVNLQLRKRTQIFSELVGIIGQASFAFETFANLKDIWGEDSDLTQAEKIQQTVSGLISSLPMLVYSLKDVKSSLVTLAQVSGANVVEGQGLLKTIGSLIAVLPGPAKLIGAIAVAAGAAAVAIDVMHKSAKEAREELVSNVEELSTNKTELESLESELSGVKSKIQELHQITDRKLTISESEDLARLEAENIALETQIELQKQLVQEKVAQIAKDAKEVVDKDAYDIEEADDVLNIGTGDFKHFKNQYSVRIGSMQDYLEAIQTMEKEIRSTSSDIYGTETYKRYQEQELVLFKERWEDAHREVADEAAKNYEEVMSFLPDMIKANTNHVYDREIEYFQSFVREYYEIMGEFDSTVARVWDNVLPDEDTFNKIQERKDKIINISKEEINTDALMDTLTPEGFENLKNQSDALGLSLYDLVFYLTQNGIAYEQLGVKGTEANNKISEDINNQLNFLDGLNSILEKINESGDLSKLKDKELDFLQELDNAYSSLGDIQNKNSHEYLHALREIREQQEDNAMQELENQKLIAEQKAVQAHIAYKDAIENGASEIDVDETIDNINEALEEIADQEYKIKLQIDTDLATDVENAFGIANELDYLKEHINEDLEYTFEEAQELINRGYGEMFTNAQETANSTIKVNKSVLAAYVNDKESEVEVDRQAKILQLEHQKSLLQTQKSALVSKLSALKEAASAENAVDAASALQKAQNSDKEYKKAVDALNAELKGETEGATKTENINAELFNSLGGMYQNNSANQQQSEVDITNTQAREISVRIRNLQLLQDAYNHVGMAKAAAARGGVHRNGMNGSVSYSSGGIKQSGLKESLAKGFEEELISEEDLKQFFEDGPSKEYQDTIGALIDQTQNQINQLDNQMGAADAGIAALKTTDSSLDKAVKDAGTGKGNKGSKEKTPKEEKPEDPDYIEGIKEERDVYHDINLVIKALNQSLDKLTTEQKKLTGKDLINNLNEQLDILEKQKEAYAEKLEIAKSEAALRRGILQDQGVEFDQDGIITNYNEILDQKLQALNAMIIAYNSMDAETQKQNKASVEKAKEDYENFKKMLEEYEETTTDLMPELEKEIQDAIDEQIEIKIKEFTLDIDLKLDYADAEREFNKFKKNIIDQIKDDDILGNAMGSLKDFSSYYKDNKKGSIDALTKHINETLFQLNQINQTGTSSIYGDNKAQGLEDLKKYYKELMDQLKDVQDLIDEINKDYLDMIDEAKDKFDDQIGQYEYISDLIKHNINIIELMYGKDAYDSMQEFYNKQEQNNNKQLDFYKQQVIFWKEKMNAEEVGSEAWEKYKKNWEDSVQGLNSLVENSINNLIDKYSNGINKIFNDLNNKVTNDKGLDYVEEEWDLINQNADAYLDKINSMYEIQNLENKYLDALKDTDSLGAQQKINDLMSEQIGMLKSKEKITQYDVDRANALYEIALKEIALEEAQQNKSKMRLRRDSQGNYTYQYVSDEDKIAEAQQELADAQNSLYNMDKERYKENLNEVYDVYTEFNNKIKDLYLDQTLSAEEREEKKRLLVEQYEQLINGLVEQNQTVRNNLYDSAFNDLADLYHINVEEFQNMSDEEKDILMNSLIPQWTSGIQDMTDAFAGDEGFAGTCKDAWKDLEESTKDYQDSLQDLEDSANINFDSIANGYDENIQHSEDLLLNNEELIQKYLDQLNAIQSICAEMDKLIYKYSTARKEAIAATEAAYKFQQMENERLNNINTSNGTGGINSQEGKSSNSSNDNSSNSYSNSSSSSASSNNNNGGNGGDGIPKVGDIVTYESGYYYDSSTGAGPAQHRGVGKKVKITKIHEGNPYPIHVYSTDSAFGWLKKDQISGYDTGGYTGNWNDSNGKLGILHQKEIVLNRMDTSNLLSAIEIIRSLDNTISTLRQNITIPINSYPLNGIKNSNSNRDISQEIHINADFPNVSEAKEIQEAFNNLTNIASQYAFKSNK